MRAVNVGIVCEKMSGCKTGTPLEIYALVNQQKEKRREKKWKLKIKNGKNKIKIKIKINK